MRPLPNSMHRRPSIARILAVALALTNLLFGFGGSFASDLEPSGNELADWPHWRGPFMDGIAHNSTLVESWSPDGENLIWRKEEFATRATPVAMNGRIYVVCRDKPETKNEGEKTVCIDAESGEMIWESIHNVYLSDAPAERVGWSSVVCDPETDRVYVLGLGCVFECLDGKTGKLIWQHSMSEEYGMLSTYGGRTNFPTVFEDLVIISGVMTGWGDTAVPAHRFVAFDKNSGVAAWLVSTKVRPEDTTYSTPVFTTFNGEAAMVVGAADGAVYALQPRTGKTIWKYQASTRGINTTPLVDDKGIVYCGHGEQNITDTKILGAVFAFDGNTKGEIPETKLLWKAPKRTVGRSAPLKVKDRLYVLEDGALMIIYDATTGKQVGEKKLGRIMFGSLIYGDGKIYAAENTGRIWILKPTEKGVDVISQVRLSDGGEVYGSFAVANDRLYLPTNTALYCIGIKEKKDSYTSSNDNAKRLVDQEAPIGDDKAIAHIQIAPVEILLQSGKTADYQIRGYNARGQFIKLVDDANVTVEGVGEFDNKAMKYTASGVNESSSIASITAKYGELSSAARVRVIAPLPWSFDFNDKKVPPAWIGASYRHQPKDADGESVLVKISTIPKGTRSQSWMGVTSLSDYSVQGDFYATDMKGKETTDRLPDMGLVAQRYTLDLQGNAQRLQIRSWTPRLELRFAKTIDFAWTNKTWYTMKFQSQTIESGVTLRGKVWKRGDPEPEAWSIEATDETPNRSGSPGMFGNSTDAEFYVDNIKVTK